MSFFFVFDSFNNLFSFRHSDTDGFYFLLLPFSRYIQRLFEEFKATFLCFTSLTSHTTISTYTLNTLFLAKASFLGKHQNFALKTSRNEKNTNLKLDKVQLHSLNTKNRISYLAFLSGFLSQVLVLGVTFPDKLAKFCCLHHLSYYSLKHFSSSSSWIHLPHIHLMAHRLILHP